MKSIKKWLPVLLCMMLVFACACGEVTPADEQNPEDPTGTGEPTEVATEATITFDSDGGTPVDPITVEIGKRVQAPADPTKEGYVFQGWLRENGSVFSFGVKLTEDVKLKADWLEIGEAVTPELESQPESVEVSEALGGNFTVEVKQTRGYAYTFKWYLNDKKSYDGGNLLEGDTNAAVIPAHLTKGKTYYAYAEITGTRTATGANATAKTGFTKITVGDRPINILVIGSGPLVRTVSGEEHNSAHFLQQISRASGKAVIVDTICEGSNYNLWETGLVGTGYSKVAEKFSDRMYDFVILQVGRDYIVSNTSVVNNEKLAINNIYDFCKTFNPGVKVACVVPYARQDMTTKYYTDAYSKVKEPNIITDRASLSTVLDKIWNVDLLPNLTFTPYIIDANKTFEYAIKQGIQPYVDEKNDFAGVAGSYLLACSMYARIFDQSPVGIKCFEAGNLSVEPSLGVKLQAIAAKITLGKETTTLPSVEGYTKYVDTYAGWITVDPKYKNDPIYKYPTPTMAGITPASTAEKKIKVAIFGGFPVGYYDMYKTLTDFIKERENVDVTMSAMTLSHTSTATTYNIFEFFESESRGDINKINWSTLGAAKTMQTAIDSGLDYLILQTGRDMSIGNEDYGTNNIVSAAKIAKLAAEVNPEVKVILVAPYPHAATFSDMKSLGIENLEQHVPYINKEAEKAKDMIVSKGFAKNVSIAYVSNAFLAYGDMDAIKADLYAKDNKVTARTNTGNRANAAGAYLTAAVIYSQMFQHSPVGANVFGTGGGETYSGFISDGKMMLKLQKVAHKAVFGKDIKYDDPVHTMSFVTNGKSEVAPIVAKTGATVTQPADPVNGTLTFCGWFVDPALTTRFSFMQNTMPAGDITLYAGWSKTGTDIRSYGEWNKNIQNVLFVGSGVTMQSGTQSAPEFFQAIAKAKGHEINVKTLCSGSNYNIWETGLVGEGASKIDDLCKDNKFDTIVLQLGRDSVLLNASTAKRELEMISTIYTVASKHNPDVQFVMLGSYGRQDTSSSYYKNYYSPLKITKREEQIPAIEKYIDSVCMAVATPFITVDLAPAFELAIKKADITPYGSLTNDYQDVYGAYLSACCIYAGMFGDSPFGIQKFDSTNYHVLPSYATRLQAIAAETVLGIKDLVIPEIDDKTWSDPDTGSVSIALPPVKADGSQIPVYFDDETVEGALNVYCFGGYTMGSFNMANTLKNLIAQGQKQSVNFVSSNLGHDSSSTTWNLYELFSSNARSSRTNFMFASGGGAQTAYKKFHSTKFDYIILQTGREFSLASTSSQTNNINSVVKLAQLAVEKNPDVKVILVAPYGHTVEFGDFESMAEPITTTQAQVEAIDAEAEAAKTAVIDAGITKNVKVVKLGDLFASYNSDFEVVKADLYREKNEKTGRINTANRATAKGSYLAACAIYATMFDKSPTGLGYFGYSTSSINGTLEKDDAIAMQKLASKFVLGDEGKVPDKFTVDILTNGAGVDSSYEANEGDKVEEPTMTLAKEGYNFKGWFKDADMTQKFDFANDTVPFGGLTLFAKWKPILDPRTMPEIKSNAKTGAPRKLTVLIIGSGQFERSNLGNQNHDVTEFMKTVFDKGGYSLDIRKIIISTTDNYNIWEAGLVGTDYSKVEDLTKDGKVNFVIIQGDRDYALNGTGSSGINGSKKIYEIAHKNNPNCKIVLSTAIARQNKTTNYYKNIYLPMDIENRDEHSFAVHDYVTGKLLKGLNFTPIVADNNRAFTECVNNFPINPWSSETSDSGSTEGDYLMACVFYAAITGKSPYGLLTFTNENNSRAVLPSVGLELQKIASRIVLNQTEFKSLDVSDTYQERKATNIMFIGNKLFSDNGAADSVDAMIKEFGKVRFTKTLSGCDNVYDYSTSVAFKNELKYGELFYDYIVIELGRDENLYDSKAAEKELAGIKSISEAVKKINPDAQIILVLPQARQNTTSQFFVNQASKSKISDREGYAKLIAKYASSLKAQGYNVVNVAEAAEKLIEKGVNPYINSVSDNLSKNGSYLASCLIFGQIMGEVDNEMITTGGANAEDLAIIREVANSFLVG